jgi:hypothetical protein
MQGTLGYLFYKNTLLPKAAYSKAIPACQISNSFYKTKERASNCGMRSFYQQ